MRMRGAGERAMLWDRRITQRVAYYTAGLAEEVAWAVFAELRAELHAAEGSITDPRLRALMATVAKELLDQHHQHLVGFLTVAAKQAAHQINRDSTPAPPGQVQRSSVRGAGGEQDAPEARIYETLLDFLENPSKLRVPEISPAIMLKEGERPAQEPDENTVQPEPNGAPVRGVDTPSQPGDGQTVFDQEVQLQQRLDAAEAKLDHQRALKKARKQRWQERNPDRARKQNTKDVRAYRARKRQQGS